MDHRVVDKYEQGEHIENIDVLDISGSHDLIVTISTLEHVGDDRGPKRGVTGHGEEQGGSKAVAAIEHLRGCLAPGGSLLFTVPVGFNRALDEAVAAGIPGVKTSFLRRIDRENRWVEAEWPEVSGASYGYPFSRGERAGGGRG